MANIISTNTNRRDMTHYTCKNKHDVIGAFDKLTIYN